MHPMISHRNAIAQRDHPVVMQGRSLRHRIRAAFEHWKRQRMIAALKGVNRHWLADAGIDRNNIERLVDEAVQRELPLPPVARPVHCAKSHWKAAA